MDYVFLEAVKQDIKQVLKIKEILKKYKGCKVLTTNKKIFDENSKLRINDFEIDLCYESQNFCRLSKGCRECLMHRRWGDWCQDSKRISLYRYLVTVGYVTDEALQIIDEYIIELATILAEE